MSAAAVAYTPGSPASETTMRIPVTTRLSERSKPSRLMNSNSRNLTKLIMRRIHAPLTGRRQRISSTQLKGAVPQSRTPRTQGNVKNQAPSTSTSTTSSDTMFTPPPAPYNTNEYLIARHYDGDIVSVSHLIAAQSFAEMWDADDADDADM